MFSSSNGTIICKSKNSDKLHLPNCIIQKAGFKAACMYYTHSISRSPFRLCTMSCGHRETWTTFCSRRAATDQLPSTSPPSSWRRRIFAGCRLNTTDRPRSSSCWERLWRRWSWGSRPRNRRWAPETSPLKSCWRCCRAKGCPRGLAGHPRRRNRREPGASLRLRPSWDIWRSYWIKRRRRTSISERYSMIRVDVHKWGTLC